MTSTSDWLHFHQNNPSAAETGPGLLFSGRASDPAVGSSTMMGSMTGSPPMGQAQLGLVPGRVSKPARKRTRASRRTPTTLLKTDTTNFRAMVQQFTGGPSSSFDFQGPGPQMYGQGYGVQIPMGQLQQPMLGPIQYSSISSNNTSNNSNNIMFMQSTMGESFNTTSDGRNINVDMRLNGSGGGSTSSENRSINSMNSFHY